jgi:hypothetical protein
MYLDYLELYLVYLDLVLELYLDYLVHLDLVLGLYLLISFKLFI